MSVISINGLPGKGKTLTATAFALKHYKKQNSLLKQFIRKIKKEPVILNNVYSNYPILLDKRKKIYSNKVSIYDLKNQYSFLPRSLIIIDEIQLFFDSDEYKKFPRIIANFNQAHRHFGIQDIIYISQHPSRVVKKLRNVVSEYYRIKTRFCIPILKIGFISMRVTYEFFDYEMAFTKDKELKKMKDIKSKIIFCNFRKLYNAYDTVYLFPINADSPLKNSGTYDSLLMPDMDVDLLKNVLFHNNQLKKSDTKKVENSDKIAFL